MNPDPDEHSYPGEEKLGWKHDDHEKHKKKTPKAVYNKFAEHARSMISGEKQCSMFCGGKKCKYCIPTVSNWPKERMVIKGLFSEWVTDNILAMSRPSDKHLEEIIDEFKQHGIKTVINLQSPGEHSDCGHGLVKSGFSYTPQKFMDSNIYFYNFGWPDYGVAALSFLLDIVKVMQFGLSDGKVAVHCHAGLGRTGVLIAAYLVFTNRISANTAIHYVRCMRPGAIQTRGQMNCIKEFEAYLKPFRVVFASRADSHEFTLSHYLNRQKHIIHGYEARKLKYIPKVLYVACERLLELAQLGSSLSRFIRESEKEVHRETMRTIGLSELDAGLPKNLSRSSLDELGNTLNVLGPKAVKGRSLSMEDLNDENLKHVNQHDDTVSTDSSSLLRGGFSIGGDGDDDYSGIGNEDAFHTASIPPVIIEGEEWNKLSPLQVAEALGAVMYDDLIYNYAQAIEENLNQNDMAWVRFARETNPATIALVMWEWLDQLKEPILRTQDLNAILLDINKPEVGLARLEKGARQTIQYLMCIVLKFEPLPVDLESKILEKFCSYLSHQWVIHPDEATSLDSWSMSTRDSGHGTSERDHWTEMKPGTAAKLLQFFRNLKTHVQKSSTETPQADDK